MNTTAPTRFPTLLVVQLQYLDAISNLNTQSSFSHPHDPDLIHCHLHLLNPLSLNPAYILEANQEPAQIFYYYS